MARFVRSVRDKLERLVLTDAGLELQDTLHALLRADDILDADEITSLLGSVLRDAVRHGSQMALAVVLNTHALDAGKCGWLKCQKWSRSVVVVVLQLILLPYCSCDHLIAIINTLVLIQLVHRNKCLP